MSEFKGNKGEWSEVYVLLKLIADGVLKSKVGDENSHYDIVSLKRNEKNGVKTYSIDDNIVNVFKDSEKRDSIPRSDIEKQALKLFKEIKKLKRGQILYNAELYELLKNLDCSQLKASSVDKSDIHVVIHDHITGMRPELGFSVKSKVGGDSTILNASRATQFTYTVEGKLSEGQKSKLESMHHFNSKGDKAYEVRDILALLKDYGCRLKFDCVEHEVANANYIKLDSCLPALLAECLLSWFFDREKNLTKIASKLQDSNPLNFPIEKAPDIYSFKLKKFLLEVVLGMKPATSWSGKYDATGGFIVIEGNGDVICYHLIQHNLLENYIFENTYLDTPSSSKFYSYGGLEFDQGVPKIKLTLQIRFSDQLKI